MLNIFSIYLQVLKYNFLIILEVNFYISVSSSPGNGQWDTEENNFLYGIL